MSQIFEMGEEDIAAEVFPHEEIRQQEKIFCKKPLTPYQQHINEAAANICLANPSMLTQRNELLKQSCEHVDKSGYQYKKRRSRSKSFGSESKLSTPK